MTEATSANRNGATEEYNPFAEEAQAKQQDPEVSRHNLFAIKKNWVPYV